MSKVIIIGAGIAGLTCGVYTQMNGFDTEIYELHTIPGGECTGWDRGEYHFDGCLHWLVGSKPGTPLNKVWRDTGALDDTVRIVNHEIFTRYEEDGAAVNFYADADRLQAHFLELAPEDRKEIKAFCGTLRRMGGFGMPADKPMDMMTGRDGIAFLAKNAGALMKMNRYGKLTMQELAGRFKNPLLRRAVEASMPGNYTAMALITTLAGMHGGDCGYPLGGSRALAKRMEARFRTLGGKVHYNARVERVLVENGKAVGIRLTDGREAYADDVVSCADAYATLTHMLEDRYTPELYKNLFANPQKYPTITGALVFMGVGTKIESPCRSLDIRRETPSDKGFGDRVTLLHYGFEHFAPEGKSVAACFYSKADFDYWNAIYPDKERYRAEKKRLEEDAVSMLIKRFPEAEGKVEVTDVVTPMTYVRYCGTWRGTWMTWPVQAEGIPRYYPGVLPGLENFIMAGMWTLPPGGLPGAGASGRFAAYRLCIQKGIEFKTA